MKKFFALNSLFFTCGIDIEARNSSTVRLKNNTFGEDKTTYADTTSSFINN